MSSFPPLPPNASKRSRSFYWFEQDLEDLDDYFMLLERGAAIAGKQLSISKTEYVRDILHSHMNEVIRPKLQKIRAPKAGQETSEKLAEDI